jgi:short-subunit dehydrogenase
VFIKHVAGGVVDGGAIVNISSLSAYDPLSGIVGYAASKAPAGAGLVSGLIVSYPQ